MKEAKSDKRGGAEGAFIGRKHIMLFFGTVVIWVGELVSTSTKGTKTSFSLHQKFISLTGGGFLSGSSMVTEAIFVSGDNSFKGPSALFIETSVKMTKGDGAAF